MTTKAATHTPGPWRITLKTDTTHYIESEHFKIGQAYNKVENGIAAEYVLAKEAEANARLIAAAPEMLEALEGILGNAQLDIDDGALALSALAGIRYAARAAIQKARGGQ
jgi:hypothetical protein